MPHTIWPSLNISFKAVTKSPNRHRKNKSLKSFGLTTTQNVPKKKKTQLLAEKEGQLTVKLCVDTNLLDFLDLQFPIWYYFHCFFLYLFSYLEWKGKTQKKKKKKEIEWITRWRNILFVQVVNILKYFWDEIYISLSLWDQMDENWEGLAVIDEV